MHQLLALLCTRGLRMAGGGTKVGLLMDNSRQQQPDSSLTSVSEYQAQRRDVLAAGPTFVTAAITLLPTSKYCQARSCFLHAKHRCQENGSLAAMLWRQLRSITLLLMM
jgi:hypothetical protein